MTHFRQTIEQGQKRYDGKKLKYIQRKESY